MPLRDIEGQAHALEALRRALDAGRLHHACLFAGPDGVGKRLTAIALAQALLCEAPQALDGCGTCSPCKRVLAGAHPDLHQISRALKPDGTPTASIRIAQVRELQQDLGKKAFEGGRRVVIIDEPERMNPATANALLKTLEEPGEGTHFVLVTAAPHKLLPTIVSRCQRVRFVPLERGIVARHLARLGEVEPEVAQLLAGLAEGSIGIGLELARSEVLEQREAIIGRVDAQRLQVAAVLELAEKLATQKPELPLIFHVLRTWYRDLLLVQRGIREGLVHQDLLASLEARAPQLNFEAIASRIDAINASEALIFERSANLRLALEALLMTLAGARRAA